MLWVVLWASIQCSLADSAAHSLVALKALGHCLLQASLLQRQSLELAWAL